MQTLDYSTRDIDTLKYYNCISHRSYSALKFLLCVGLALGLMLKNFFVLGLKHFFASFFAK
jgi:hypothetical protein